MERRRRRFGVEGTVSELVGCAVSDGTAILAETERSNFAVYHRLGQFKAIEQHVRASFSYVNE